MVTYSSILAWRIPWTEEPGRLQSTGLQRVGHDWVTELIKSESEVAQLCPTLCDPMDCSLPGSSLHGILQARVLEWVAISFSRGSSQPRDWTRVSCIPGRRFNLWATREAQGLNWLGIYFCSGDQMPMFRRDGFSGIFMFTVKIGQSWGNWDTEHCCLFTGLEASWEFVLFPVVSYGLQECLVHWD